LPPWPSINSDLLCVHNELSLANGGGLKSRRKAIDSRSWYLLRRFYPAGPAFKCSTSVECSICLREKEGAKASAIGKKEAQLQVRRTDFVPADLAALAARKCGVPTSLITSRFDGGLQDELFPSSSVNNSSFISSIYVNGTESDSESIYSSLQENSYSLSPFNTSLSTKPPSCDNIHEIEDSKPYSSLLASTSPTYQQPLVPGLYNLVPKDWLRTWRRYLKDPELSSLPSLDCTSLFCNSHGIF